MTEMRCSFSRWLVLVVLLALGCAADPVQTEGDAGVVADAASQDDAAADDAASGPACATTPTYAELRDTIFTRRCATGVCHGGTTGTGRPEGPGNYTASSTRDVWVNRSSVWMRGLVVVRPGDPDGSFMLRKLTNDLNPNPRIEGEPMPDNGRMPWEQLPDEEIAAIRCWIAGGAP
jgi:hypothetical protein